MRRASVRPRALVIGAGPIGLGTAIFARAEGCRVTVLDTSAERLASSREWLEAAVIDGTGGVAEAVAAARWSSSAWCMTRSRSPIPSSTNRR